MLEGNNNLVLLPLEVIFRKALPLLLSPSLDGACPFSFTNYSALQKWVRWQEGGLKGIQIMLISC